MENTKKHIELVSTETFDQVGRQALFFKQLNS